MAAFVLTEETQRLIVDIKNLDKKFRKSCDQILLLNNQIEDLQVRYERAMKSNRRSFRYSLRLRLATLEGVRNMFYEYASRCADSLELLQTQLVDSGGREELYDDRVEWEPVASSDEDDDVTNEPAPLLDQSTDSVNSQSEISTSQVVDPNQVLPQWDGNMGGSSGETDSSTTDSDNSDSSSSLVDTITTGDDNIQETSDSANEIMDTTTNHNQETPCVIGGDSNISELTQDSKNDNANNVLNFDKDVMST